MRSLVSAFNHEKALVGAFSVIVKTDGWIVCSSKENLSKTAYSYIRGHWLWTRAGQMSWAGEAGGCSWCVQTHRWNTPVLMAPCKVGRRVLLSPFFFLPLSASKANGPAMRGEEEELIESSLLQDWAEDQNLELGAWQQSRGEGGLVLSPLEEAAWARRQAALRHWSLKLCVGNPFSLLLTMGSTPV